MSNVTESKEFRILYAVHWEVQQFDQPECDNHSGYYMPFLHIPVFAVVYDAKKK